VPSIRPTLKELIKRIESDFESRLTLVGGSLSRSAVAVFSRVVAGATHGLYGFIDYLSRQFFADTADDFWLQKKAAVYGITKIAANFAAGPIVFTGTDGAVVLAGTDLKRSDGATFTTLADATISGGVATATVDAEIAGFAANTAAGIVLTLVEPVEGVQSGATVDAAGIVDGTNIEGTESLRARLLDRKRQPPAGGAAFDYPRWAKEVSGVTRAWVYPVYLGPGTVGVAFVTDDTDPITPTPTKVAQVQDYINLLKPVTADVTVFAPSALVVDLSITLLPNTAAVRAAVLLELADLFSRVGEPGLVIAQSKLGEAVSVSSGESSNNITAPVGDITPATYQIPVLGEVTFS
jgi:uncharacterized phage protein gp47/JayE